MRKDKFRRIYITIAAMVMAGMMTACSASGSATRDNGVETVKTEASVTRSEEKEVASTEVDNKSVDATVEEKDTADADSEKDDASEADAKSKSASGDSDIFTDRDLAQTADLTGAENIALSSGQDVSITKEGVYVLSGDATDVTVTVEAADEDKVQIVLDGVSVKNEGSSFIYVKSADKVFVTTTESENKIEVTGEFKSDGDTNVDAAIFSKDDLVVNGLGTLSITSSDNGITSKDTLKITGSIINVSCEGSAFEAHDAIEIADGVINVTECNDGLHAEDNDDDTIGAIYIGGGTFNIKAADDAIHATTTIDIKGGEFTLEAGECIEGTYITIDDGKIDITASDDGINAAAKSKSYTPTFVMNGGEVTITMGAGDTDGVDSNGNIVINGGTISVSGQSTFDYDGTAEYNGGTIIENGVETNTMTSQTFGPGGMGGPGGNMRDFGNMNPEDFGNMNPEDFKNMNPEDFENMNPNMMPPNGKFNQNEGFNPSEKFNPNGNSDSNETI